MDTAQQIVNNFGNEFLIFLEKFLNIFLVEGISTDTQQLVKIVILLILLLTVVLLVSVLTAIIGKVMAPAINGMSESEYVFGSILAILIFIFTDATFTGAGWLIFGFGLIWLTNQYMIEYKPKKDLEKKRELETY